jgi:hypothetical protein
VDPPGSAYPDGFRAEREGAVIRVHLPEVMVTETRVLEPMLTRRDALALAEALWHAGASAPLARVVLLRDFRHGRDAVAAFHRRLVDLLVVGGGMDVRIEVQVAGGPDGPQPTGSE